MEVSRIRIEGIEYTPEAVNTARIGLIELRNAALGRDSFDWAVLLSHVLVYLADYAEVLEEETAVDPDQP